MIGGEFFDPPRNEPPHTCWPPEIYSSTAKGWRCDCGKAYVQEQQSQHGESWMQWRRSPKHDGQAES